MSEITLLCSNHPLLLIFALCLSPIFISLLVIFSPLLVTLMLFLLGIAGLARSRRSLGGHRSRRSRKHARNASSSHGGWLESGLSGDGLECEKQLRVNEYLEDQLKNLEALQVDSLDDVLFSGCVSDDAHYDLDLELNCAAVRSDLSEIGDHNSARHWEAGNDEDR